MVYISLFVLFLLIIVLYAVLRLTASQYPFGIFKLFLVEAKMYIFVLLIYIFLVTEGGKVLYCWFIFLWSLKEGRFFGHWRREGSLITEGGKVLSSLKEGRLFRHWRREGSFITEGGKVLWSLKEGRFFRHWRREGSFVTEGGKVLWLLTGLTLSHFCACLIEEM
jgi:hypothetical protein